ncbi:MAG: sigma factor-like helix-turn-helix DNA-binding protein [Thermaerobacter sp.]|nr:sigma factor-like helix-turn-helix DNA-binding protein [Thermaerobacter sp.]
MAEAYGPLLTVRQREVWTLVYDQDWSLAEVAAAVGITRTAVALLLKRAQERLVAWEERLGLVAAEDRRAAHFAMWAQLLASLPDGPAAQALASLYDRWVQEEGYDGRRPAVGEARDV